MPDAGRRRHALVVALLANAVAGAVKLTAFFLTGASVLLSEGLHSVADCGNQGALLLGHRHAAGGPSARHPLGRGRVRYLWAFLVAVVIFGASAAGAFAEATYRLLNPGHHEHLSITLGALGVALVIEAASFGSALGAARTAKGAQSWRGFITRSRDPDLPVLLVEDVTDLVGLGLAVAGSVLAALTGAPVLDAIASYVIAIVLTANAVFLAWEMGSLVLGEAPQPEVQRAISAAVDSVGGSWRGTHVQAVHVGPDDLLIIIEIVPPGEPDPGALLARLEQARDRVAVASSSRARVVFEIGAPQPAPAITMAPRPKEKGRTSMADEIADEEPGDAAPEAAEPTSVEASVQQDILAAMNEAEPGAAEQEQTDEAPPEGE